MATKDTRVDAYIAKARPFAQPILLHLRKLVHAAVPEVEETMKWSFPHFDVDGMMCSMAAFKEHCAFGFWKASLMSDPHKIMGDVSETAMGHFGRITSMRDLPSEKILTAYIKEAAALNKDGVKLPARPKTPKKTPKAPAYFLAAVKQNKKAYAAYEAFSPSHKAEYIEWITEAKSEETRNRRIKTMLEWLEEGKPRNWKYMKKY